jgi:glycosyltransferase involved in cell wall biosynthesis
VPLEAAAMERPVISTTVPGCVDAVADGLTGLLVPAGEAGPLCEAMGRYATDPLLRLAHGEAGRARAEREFSRERIADAFVDLYQREISAI